MPVGSKTSPTLRCLSLTKPVSSCPMRAGCGRPARGGRSPPLTGSRGGSHQCEQTTTSRRRRPPGEPCATSSAAASTASMSTRWPLSSAGRLWMEALEPGRPLSFLDAHIKCGNSLLGATPDLIAAGIPDDAFKRIDGVAPSASVGMDDPDLGFSSPFTADRCSDPPRTLSGVVSIGDEASARAGQFGTHGRSCASEKLMRRGFSPDEERVFCFRRLLPACSSIRTRCLGQAAGRPRTRRRRFEEVELEDAVGGCGGHRPPQRRCSGRRAWRGVVYSSDNRSGSSAGL